MSEKITSQAADRVLLLEALEGRRGDDQRLIAEAVVQMGATLIRKNTDYGNSVWKPPVLQPSLPPRSAIMVRMSDKVCRIAQLSEHPALVAESLEDTMRDLASYGILWLAASKEPT